ncbi:transcriptional regulator [Rhizobium tropici]|uniref:Transcriptional regulator n=1 Tax=Rhizobium tropici TaxID=398 RepID=A0A5B0WBM1_RHITR|nr:transcriptional repressor TraM [Rhizobium tropici]KAA1183888.1 transcriptional regulator [Rhizobium tropici]
MNDAGSSEADEQAVSASRYRSMQESELEALAVSTILEHRRLLVADEAVYDEWTRATADPSVSRDVLASLQDEYLARQKTSEAQQQELSEIIDILGYVPEVPLDDEK